MHPIAFHLGPFPVHWYGVMVALGFLLGLWTASRRGVREGVTADRIMDLGPWLILGAIVGARTLYVISYWKEQFAGKPIWEIFMVQHGGLVYYGGLVGSSLAFIVYAFWKKLPLWKGADILAPSVALGHALGRIGCLFNGCCYGRPCSLPWGITYPDRPGGPPAGIPLHPSQVYESILNLILYATLAWLYRRKRFDGQIFAIYLVSYAFIRSFVELFRGDYPQYYFGWVTPAHLVSVVILVIGALLLRVLPRATPRTEG